MLDRAVRTLRRSDEIESLQRELAQRRAAAEERGLGADDGVAAFLTWRPPGHFYSPVPNLREVRRRADRFSLGLSGPLEGLDLNEDDQLALFERLAPLVNDATLSAEPSPARRYVIDNPSYGTGDAAIAQAFLRHLKPKRYLEVGSGWTTALALDANDEWLDRKMRVTCIEPHPGDLEKLLRPTDDVEVLAIPVQDVPLSRFEDLEPDDVLFIDCSHVVKAGSDAHHLITRVLPVVPVGVYVHIHDIFWPFEYPLEWIEQGRAWSEAYLLHAFLLFNPAFRIVFFNHWFTLAHYDLMTRQAPALAPGAGGAIWLRRQR